MLGCYCRTFAKHFDRPEAIATFSNFMTVDFVLARFDFVVCHSTEMLAAHPWIL